MSQDDLMNFINTLRIFIDSPSYFTIFIEKIASSSELPTRAKVLVDRICKSGSKLPCKISPQQIH